MKPLKTNFKPDDPLASISADWLNTVGRLLNGASIVNGRVYQNEDGLMICPGPATADIDFAWNVTGDATSLSITPGDIELGPDTVIPWASISGAVVTISTAAWIWVNVNVTDGEESAEMLYGGSVTSLTSEEKKHICQKRIAYIETVDGVTTIRRYQCGNIFIPRL